MVSDVLSIDRMCDVEGGMMTKLEYPKLRCCEK